MFDLHGLLILQTGRLHNSQSYASPPGGSLATLHSKKPVGVRFTTGASVWLRFVTRNKKFYYASPQEDLGYDSSWEVICLFQHFVETSALRLTARCQLDYASLQEVSWDTFRLKKSVCDYTSPQEARNLDTFRHKKIWVMLCRENPFVYFKDSPRCLRYVSSQEVISKCSRIGIDFFNNKKQINTWFDNFLHLHFSSDDEFIDWLPLLTDWTTTSIPTTFEPTQVHLQSFFPNHRRQASCHRKVKQVMIRFFFLHTRAPLCPFQRQYSRVSFSRFANNLKGFTFPFPRNLKSFAFLFPSNLDTKLRCITILRSQQHVYHTERYIFPST